LGLDVAEACTFVACINTVNAEKNRIDMMATANTFFIFPSPFSEHIAVLYGFKRSGIIL
jgi:hypothetical protein